MTELEGRLRTYFRGQLRRFFSRSPVKSAIYAERKENGGWCCYICGGFSPYKKDFQIEHVSPVVPPERSYVPSFEYFQRMFGYTADGFLDLSNMQISCIPCHEKKTSEEDSLRRQHGTGRFSLASKEKARATRARKKEKRHARKAKKRA